MSKLLLIPNLLGDSLLHHELYLPGSVDKAMASIDGLISESEGGGRRFLKRFKTKKPPHEMPIALFNVNTPDDEVDFLLEPMKNGEVWALISDAGLPCIADPGAKLVARAKQMGIKVQAFVGPCSFILALMQSGLPGQRFRFNGYLPKDEPSLKQKITDLEKESRAEQATQIFMEAPYRSKRTLDALLETLEGSTELCVAWDLTMPTQGIVTLTVEQWKKNPLPNIDKKPAVFLVYAGD